MCENNNYFFTIWYGVYNINSKKLVYAAGGHPPAILISDSDISLRLVANNPIIGVIDKYKFTSQSCIVEIPSRLYIFTDGVYEIQKINGKMMSYDEMTDCLLDLSCSNNESDIYSLYDYITEVKGGNILEDDFTILKIVFL
jgi:sigma-B regulation protein RsbU (phosphoserine phosphatase)